MVEASRNASRTKVNDQARLVRNPHNGSRGGVVQKSLEVPLGEIESVAGDAVRVVRLLFSVYGCRCMCVYIYICVCVYLHPHMHKYRDSTY